MKESWTKNNITDTNSPEYRAFELSRRAFDFMRSRNKQVWEESDKEKDKFFISLKKKNSKIIPEGIEEIDAALKTLNNKDEEEFLNEVTKIIIKYIAKYLSLEEIENRFKQRHEQHFGWKTLSRGLTFGINEEKKSAELHMPITFFENSETAINSLKSGFQILAHKIATEEELKNIEKVTAYSSFVKKKHLIMEEMLGFNVIYKDNEPTEAAEISREKFLELYEK